MRLISIVAIALLALSLPVVMSYQVQVQPGGTAQPAQALQRGKPFAAPCITDDNETGAKIICQVHTEFTCRPTDCAKTGSGSGNGVVEPPTEDGCVDLESFYEPMLVFCTTSDGEQGTKYICSINTKSSCFETACEALAAASTPTGN